MYVKEKACFYIYIYIYNSHIYNIYIAGKNAARTQIHGEIFCLLGAQCLDLDVKNRTDLAENKFDATRGKLV